MKPWAAALLAWLIATVLFGPLAFVLVLLLAGPHGGLLPSWLAPATLLGGWGLALGMPLVVARLAFRRVTRQRTRLP